LATFRASPMQLSVTKGSLFSLGARILVSANAKLKVTLTEGTEFQLTVPQQEAPIVEPAEIYARLAPSTMVIGKDAQHSRAQWTEYGVQKLPGVVSSLAEGQTAFAKKEMGILQELNQYLATRSYICGFGATYVDILLYSVLSSSFRRLDEAAFFNLMHVSRWFDLVQHVSAEIDGNLIDLVAIPLERSTKGKAEKSSGDAGPKKEKESKKKDKAAAPVESAAPKDVRTGNE